MGLVIFLLSLVVYVQTGSHIVQWWDKKATHSPGLDDEWVNEINTVFKGIITTLWPIALCGMLGIWYMYVKEHTPKCESCGHRLKGKAASDIANMKV